MKRKDTENIFTAVISELRSWGHLKTRMFFKKTEDTVLLPTQKNILYIVISKSMTMN